MIEIVICMIEVIIIVVVLCFFVDVVLCVDVMFVLLVDVVCYVQVLCLQFGDVFVLFDGMGGQYCVWFVEVDKCSVFVQVDLFEFVEVELFYCVMFVQGIVGGDKMDWVIEKVVEFGVVVVVLLLIVCGVVKLFGECVDKCVVYWCGVVCVLCE